LLFRYYRCTGLTPERARSHVYVDSCTSTKLVRRTGPCCSAAFFMALYSLGY